MRLDVEACPASPGETQGQLLGAWESVERRRLDVCAQKDVIRRSMWACRERATSGGSRVRARAAKAEHWMRQADLWGGLGRRRSPERSAGAAKPRALRPDDVGGGGRTLRCEVTRPRLRHEAGRAGATRRAVGWHKRTALEARRTRRLERLTRREPPTHPPALG